MARALERERRSRCRDQRRHEGLRRPCDRRELHGGTAEHAARHEPVVFDSREGCWQQTWVDDSGAYLDFRGGLAGEEMHLSREVIADDGEWLQRMIFRNIEAERFDWLWQRTRGNSSWETLWEISYERLPGSR
jgi:hypothetical protein